MAKQKSKSQKIPADIVELINSEDTALKISEICITNNIEKEEDIEKIAYQVGRVLLGGLPPEFLAKGLERKENISPEIAKNIAEEIDKRIFSQVKESLSVFYKEKVLSKEKTEVPEEIKEEKRTEKKETPSKDTYRESID